MLILKNLSYHPPAAEGPILDRANLEIHPQQLSLIVGPSGSGKTTLLEILSGLAVQTAGQVLWRDRALLQEDLQQLAGLVFQFPERHFCCGTLLDELRLGHPELGSEQIYQALEAVGLAQLPLATAPQALSGGHQRRLALAVQLIRQPSLLLLDEPTAGLDWSMRRQLAALLADLKQRWSLLVVTHDASDLVDIADRCWSIDQGQVQAIAPDQLQRDRAIVQTA
ncbi:MAG: ABC transporter ATP-binding protein [Cyanophyceae cyanobacterium]